MYRDNKNCGIIFVLVLLLISMGSFAADSAATIGKVVFARGVVTTQQEGQQIRVLGKNAEIFQGDIITTAQKSFAVIKFNDDSRISLRPDTVFSVEDYSQQQASESMIIRLFKGGLRTISGLISKRNPDGFKLHTVAATIGIRGTEFDARLCEIDCAIENQKYQKVKTQEIIIVAKVAFLNGQLIATDAADTQRQLAVGSPLYVGDSLRTGTESFAVIAFRDEGRVTMKEDTEFKIEQYRYSLDNPDENGAVYRLIKGGIRALTGLISKYNKDAYKVNTPTATIGIRGTGFDLLWLGPCGVSLQCGLVGYVWDGSIFAKNDTGSWDLLEKKVILVRFIDQPAEFIDIPPVFTVPRPDEVDIDFINLFAAELGEVIEPGLYVGCYEGQCILIQADRKVDLTPGQSGFASIDGRILQRLEFIQPFQAEDPYLQTINADLETLFELLDDSVIEQTEFECIVQ
jgi:hypothetical protein